MTKEEAKKVIKTMLTADGGCNSCTHDLIEFFSEDFPEFEKMATKMWEAQSYKSRKFEDF